MEEEYRRILLEEEEGYSRSLLEKGEEEEG